MLCQNTETDRVLTKAWSDSWQSCYVLYSFLFFTVFGIFDIFALGSVFTFLAIDWLRFEEVALCNAAAIDIAVVVASVARHHLKSKSHTCTSRNKYLCFNNNIYATLSYMYGPY